MPIWNLPGFRQNAVFPPPADAGKWQLADGTLRRLSMSLNVDNQPWVDPHEPVRAIPDPWAQARTFAEALVYGENIGEKERKHPLYETSLAQWRGLLALFALRDLYSKDYTLSVRGFSFGENSLFDRVLSHLTPQIALGGRVELWQKPLIIELNGTPIGLGNPACLLSPGRETATILSFPNIPWYRDGLQDPLRCELPVTQLFILQSWLRQLRADLGGIGGDLCNRICQLLLDYANECDREGGDVPFLAKLGPSLEPGLGEPYSKLFATVALNAIDDPSKTSQTRLKLDAEANLGTIKGVILIDEALTYDPRFNRRKTLVWGTKTLGELLDSPNEFRSTAAEAAARGWMLITGDDLFTPRVAHFAKDARLAGNPPGLEEMLAPLRPLAMLLPGGPHSRISAHSGGGRAVFTLKLAIDDGTNAGQPFDLMRNFAINPEAGEGLIVEDEDWKVYTISLWPDFRSSAWENYFLRINVPSDRIGYMVRPVMGLSAVLIAAEVADQETSVAAIARLRELNAGRRFTSKKQRFSWSEKTNDGAYEELQHCCSHFEAINYLEAYGDRPEAPIGLALLNLKQIDPRGSSFDVAVDFGTTNTVACFDDEVPVKFQNRLVYPLTFANPEDTNQELFEARWLMRTFFPRELRRTPTPTVCLNRTPYPSQESHHLFRNVIYFHSHERHGDNEGMVELNKFKRAASDAKFNLKWTNDAEHAEASTDFLRQFVMMVAAEALANGRDPRRIRWRFSVPDSLDGEMRYKFEDSLRETTQSISTLIDKPEEILRDLYSEGLCAAEFILDGGAGFTRGSLNIVLDIGGGTTDVTVWDYGPIHWVGSFRLAGQNFFTRTISQNPEILGPIGLGHWQELFESQEGSEEGFNKKDVPHLAEMLFSGPALQEAIDENWNSRLRLDLGTTLRLTAQTFIAGIAWYLGRIVRQMVEDGRLREDQLANPAFALCGRGAGLFKKMHAGRAADAESETTRALKVFNIAAGLAVGARQPQLFTTPDAKLEVVRGMITSNGGKQEAAAGAERFYLSGLGATFESGAALSILDKTSRKSLVENVRAVDLSELNAFLAALKEVAEIEINLFEDRPQGAFAAIQLQVLKSLNEIRVSTDVKQELEPPFIIALRALVDMMALPAKERERRLKMEFSS